MNVAVATEGIGTAARPLVPLAEAVPSLQQDPQSRYTEELAAMEKIVRLRESRREIRRAIPSSASVNIELAVQHKAAAAVNVAPKLAMIAHKLDQITSGRHQRALLGYRLGMAFLNDSRNMAKVRSRISKSDYLWDNSVVRNRLIRMIRIKRERAPDHGNEGDLRYGKT